tara:strand:- start:400 stop:504 length:105 start_codon:yes stop_codon:yes gene_type:complete
LQSAVELEVAEMEALVLFSQYQQQAAVLVVLTIK